MDHSLPYAARHPSPDRGGVSIGDSVCICRGHRQRPAQWGWPADSTSVTRATQTVDDWRPTVGRLSLYEYSSLMWLYSSGHTEIRNSHSRRGVFDEPTHDENVSCRI